MTVMQQKGFTRTDFGRLHPGGALGTRLKPVRRLMHSGDAVPLTRENASMHDTIVEMSAKRLGVVGVTDDSGYLVGVITDGDLRRNIERGLDHAAAEFMTREPKTIAADRVTLATSSVHVRAGAPFQVGADVELAIRPERVRLMAEPGANVLEARVEGLVYQGAQTELTARLDDGQRVLVFVTEPTPVPLAVGQTVHLHLPADAFMILG